MHHLRLLRLQLGVDLHTQLHESLLPWPQVLTSAMCAIILSALVYDVVEQDTPVAPQ